MAGRRIVHLSKLLSAGKSIAYKHVGLRQQQLDVYSKTSTFARAAKEQADRVTVTAGAFIAIAKRLVEDAPSYMRDDASQSEQVWRTQAQNVRYEDSVPRRDTVQRAGKEKADQEALSQDHHYRPSPSNTTTEPVPEQELDIEQEKADRYPLPDGTIPPSGVKLPGQRTGPDDYAERPTSEPPKEPLAKEDAESVEAHAGKDGDTRPVSSAASTIPLPRRSPLSAAKAREAQRASEDPIPSVAADTQPQPHDTTRGDVFYERSEHAGPLYSSLPRAKIPKQANAEQESTEAVDDSNINPDVFYEPTATKASTSQPIPPPEHVSVPPPEQDDIPEGVNLNVFQTARVGKMLGGGSHSQSKDNHELRMKFAAKTPVEHTKITEGKDQDTFNVRSSGEDTPAEPDSKASPNMSSGTVNAEEMRSLASDLAKDAESASAQADTQNPQMSPEVSAGETKPYVLRESRVPASRLGRLWQYTSLGTSMAFGAIGESLRRATGSESTGSLMLSPGNMTRLVSSLSRMRGAALKLGQVISFQDMKMLPPPIMEVLQRVQDSADYMPASQRNKVLSANLGPDWRHLYSEFEEVPMAAASIGQVHRAVLKSTGQEVAVKVQYPGVANSIDSDLSNLSLLLTASKLLPKGLFLDKTIANARTELAWECDYEREAQCQERFRSLLKDETDIFTVPEVIKEASGKEVLTATLMHGKAVTKLSKTLTQDQRDWVGTQILRLCLREITEFHFMQTDPNWTNFLFNVQTNKLELLDFGASRDYPHKFIDLYMRVLIAASKGDRNTIRDLSIELGYLTGHESNAMRDAHVDSVLTLAEPFTGAAPEVYDFRDQTITDRVRSLIPIMVRERLAPPPEETYSLHRKLSGAFLLCSRLGSRVRCREMFERAVGKFESGVGGS